MSFPEKFTNMQLYLLLAFAVNNSIHPEFEIKDN